MADDPPTAINAAVSHNWKEAIRINLFLLKQNPKDIDSLNRLGRAYFETGQKSKAHYCYSKVLRLDKFNPIAAKNLELLKSSHFSRSPTPSPSLPPQFLEEPGVTKTVSPIRLGDPKIISRLRPGEAIFLAARQHSVSILSSQKEYLGRLPDDLASRLRPLIKGGNIYHGWIKSTQPLKIFIKEISRAPKFKHLPSFPLTEKLSYAAFTPPELVHDAKPQIEEESEEEETDEDQVLEAATDQ